MTTHDYIDHFRPELLIIPCGSRKLGWPTRAADMYIGSYHRACRKAADALQSRRLLILSGHYGLLDLDDIIEPYDTPHGSTGATTAQLLLQQATERGIVSLDPVVALGGARHTALIHTVWPHARTPLNGTRSMGEQMSRLAAMRKGQEPHPG
ncbi:DUF6884 domain-containing protein [Streptomyces sp. LN785]|uniref:DUF6884 domain-containing protein n=1 Tax=Streptomyces sp. LN785 TaxID=3112983 RepID=UPI00371E1C68